MRKQMGNAVFHMLVVAVGLLALGGWIGNIVKIVGTFDNVVTGMFIARCIGVFVAPLGAVLGYL